VNAGHFGASLSECICQAITSTTYNVADHSTMGLMPQNITHQVYTCTTQELTGWSRHVTHCH